MFLICKLIYVWGACGRKFESCRPDIYYHGIMAHCRSPFFVLGEMGVILSEKSM